MTSRVSRGQGAEIAPGDQGQHELARHVQGERLEAGDHGVERPGGVVQLAERGARQRRHPVEIEQADRRRGGPQLIDRPPQHPPEQERGRDRQNQSEEAGDGGLRQAHELRRDVLLGEIAADQPGRVAIVGKRRVQIDVFLAGDVAPVPAAGDQIPLLPAVPPDVEEYRVADLADPGQRPLLAQSGKVELERAVREDIVAIVQDERVLAELGLELGEECGQLGDAHDRHHHADEGAVAKDRAAEVQHRAGGASVDRRTPVGWPLARAPRRSPSDARPARSPRQLAALL